MALVDWFPVEVYTLPYGASDPCKTDITITASIVGMTEGLGITIVLMSSYPNPPSTVQL